MRFGDQGKIVASPMLCALIGKISRQDGVPTPPGPGLASTPLPFKMPAATGARSGATAAWHSRPASRESQPRCISRRLARRIDSTRAPA